MTNPTIAELTDIVLDARLTDDPAHDALFVDIFKTADVLIMAYKSGPTGCMRDPFDSNVSVADRSIIVRGERAGCSMVYRLDRVRWILPGAYAAE